MARKPNPITQKEIEDLRRQIEKTNGNSIKNPVDCKGLALKISEATGKYISESTLKRFLGFHDSGFAPSYDTIKILKEFVSMSKQKKTESSVSMENFVLDFLIFDVVYTKNIYRLTLIHGILQRPCTLGDKKEDKYQRMIV